MKLVRRMSIVAIAVLLVLACLPSVSLAATKPTAPKIPSVELKSACSVIVKWDKVDGAKGYEVYRAASKGGNYTKVKSTTATSFTNSELTAGKTYYYKVRAYTKAAGKTVYGKHSGVKSIKMQLQQVKLTMGSTTQSAISMSWGKIAGASGYEVNRATAQNGTYKRVASPKATTFTDDNLLAGKSYYYKVRAFSTVSGKTYYGAFSAVKTAVTVKKEPKVAFVSRNPIIETIKSDLGFFAGARINFDLIVYDAAGMTSITIEEVASGNPDGGNYKEYKQTRVIPISGPGTYQLSQEMRRGNGSNVMYNEFVYAVSACGASYSVNYPGYAFDGRYGNWYQVFGLK